MKSKWIWPLLIIALFVVGLVAITVTPVGDSVSAERPHRHHHPTGSGLSGGEGPYICLREGSAGENNHSGHGDHDTDHDSFNFFHMSCPGGAGGHG